ncbi:hypothetical protein GGH12_001255 [Coemansia sp. RSA 1822]|nr:hypothetical protein LPJ76_002898 [Coemansia sp. RSA 638]KAJ2544818.1 hypothetical protein GGF49_000877 [Coemansia sp. RSA 1853]KAJ2565665.1 hypothetical protein GGH12_001255 [Coemansia sp. RSA 1822]
MTGEQYAYTGSPHTAGEQYAGQRHATGVPIPPQTAGVSASASAARGYGALLNTHRHPHSTAQGHYTPTSGPVPPLPQHYAVGNSPRRLSNAPSDPSDKVYAGPIRAGPANNSHSSDDTSEDEIESLRRAMGSDSRAVQRQHLRREQTRSSDVPSSPATQGTSLSNAGMMSAAPGAAGLAQAVPGQGPVQGYTADISPTVQQKYTTTGMYAYPTTTMTQQTYTHAHYSHYPPRQYPPLQHPPLQHTQQQHPQQLPPMASAYAAASTNPFEQSTMTGSSAVHVPPTVAHGTTDSVSHGAQAWAVSGYPAASSGVGESSARHESASVRSNDQMSGTVTDASGYSQAYWPHYTATYEHGLAISGAAAVTTAAVVPADGYLRATHHQSPTLVHAQSPLRAATDSPMERKNGDAVPAAERERMQRVAGTVSANVHVTEAGGTGVFHGTAAAGPQAHAERLPYSYSATALAPMREMQEHPQDIAPPMASTNASAAASASGMPAEAMTGPSPIAIQSLLNSPDDKVELMQFPGSEHGSVVSDGESAAIRKHIANENARYRRQSGASGQAPMQTPEPAQKIPLAYASRIPSDSMANNDSSPNSVSSYHSAGYSMWQGRAETIMDFATAQQSFSSADDALGPAQHRSSSFFTDAPVPDLPAPFTASSSNAAEAMRAFEATVSSPEDATRPVDSSEPQSSAGYGYFKRRPKPVSVLVQVGDTHAESQVTSEQSASSNGDTDSRRLPENPFASGKSVRKATNESLDNVLEYYRTHSEEAAEPSPFELPSHPNRRVGQGLSLVSLDRVPASPLYQRTSVSSPIDKPSSSKRTNVSQWAARRTEATLDSSGSDDSMLPLARGQSSPIAFDFARRAQGAIHTPCDSAVMGVNPWRQSDVYSMLDDLPEPDDLELPASAAIGTVGGQPMYPEIPSDDHMVQMEDLDGFDELSDIVDLSTAQDSDYGYSGSNDSTDSFGEPIEHEAGMLASRDRTLAPHSMLHSEPARSAVARLADDFARVGMTAPSDAAADRALLSGRTNASTLTTSSAGNAEAAVEPTGDSTHAAPANGARERNTVNDLPLEIMEIASELELALAREQEDYFTDNDPTQPTLDPTILQSLGRAVHQQCTLQRQQLQRRKSNMQLGLGTTDIIAEEPVYADHEQALRAMLSEVSQYFEQSGLSLVFPFAAKWVNWLTRHPDRPFPWRKEDPDDELRGSGDDDASSESSFGGEPVLSRALPPDDVLSVAMIPMSKRRPARVTDIVTQEKRRGINAHWQYYSVINQIVTVASTIYHRLNVNDHKPVAHELAALYQFLGGDFKKYKVRIESMFDAVKRSQQVDGGLGVHVNALQDTMCCIITDALYSANRVVPNKENVRARAEPRAEPYSFAVATLKGLPTQPIVRYLTREMRVANSRRRGLGTLSRNTSMGHMRHPIYQVPPVPPLPLADTHSQNKASVGSKQSTSYE